LIGKPNNLTLFGSYNTKVPKQIQDGLVLMYWSKISHNNLNCWCLTPFSAIFQLYHGDQF